MSERPDGRATRTRSSLGRQIAILSAANALLVLLGLALLLGLSERSRVRLEDATSDYIEESRIAGRLHNAVLAQLIAVTAATAAETSSSVPFMEAGDEVNDETRRYLLRDLQPVERLQLEEVREHHQELEVAAARAFQLAGGDRAEVAAARRRVFAAAAEFQAALAAFLALRQEALLGLAEQQRSLLRSLRFGALALALLTLGGSFLFGRFLHRRLTVPLRELALATAQVGGGDAGARVEARHDDELGDLAAGFNRMAASVAEARRGLEQRNSELGEAMDRLRDAQNDLVQTEKLGALGRMIAGLAHELNNPLASVLGHVELLAVRLEDGEEPDARQLRSEFVMPVVEAATRARDLVRSLLHFSRSSAPDLEPVSLRTAMDVVIGLRRFAFEQAGIDLVIDVPDVLVYAERQRLQQVFLNLTNNGLEAMTGDTGVSPDASLRITAAADDGSVVVTFDDDGPGMQRPDRVFDPFYTTKEVGQGTGLGLTLVHGFIDEFGGDIRAENRAEGGARLTIRLRQAVGERTEPTASPTPSLRPIPPRDGDAPRILVVEDEAPLRRLQEAMLKRIGAHVTLAESGSEAKQILERITVDLVITDVKMPDGNGVELYDWILRERPELRDRVLLVTGNLGDPAVIDIAENEPQRVVAKPFSLEEYLAKVNAALQTGNGARR